MIAEKRENGIWWFYDEFYTGGFTPYPFGCIIDKTANTFVLTKENRPSYPKEPLPVAEVKIRVLPSTSLETYTTGELLENRLLALEFPPLVVGVAPSEIPAGVVINKGMLNPTTTTITAVTNETHLYFISKNGSVNGTLPVKVGDIIGINSDMLWIESNNNQLTENQLAAVQNAPSPSGTNHFITQNEINPLLHPIKTINASIIPDVNGNAIIPDASLTTSGLMNNSTQIQNILGKKNFKMGTANGTDIGFSVENLAGAKIFSIREHNSLELNGVTIVNSALITTGLIKVINNLGNIQCASGVNPTIGFFHDVYQGRNIVMNLNNGNTLIGATLGVNAFTEKFEVISNTRGSIPAPRMTSAQRSAIVAPTIGSIVTQTDGTAGIYIYTASGWKRMLTEA